MWLKDPKTGKKSATLTILVMTVLVALSKVLMSGIVIKSVNLGTFSGSEFSVMLTAAGALYWGRKHSDKDKE